MKTVGWAAMSAHMNTMRPQKAVVQQSIHHLAVM
jgi:hypothetical protein